MELQKGKFKKTDFIEIETQKELWQNINPDKLEHKFIVTGIVTVEDMKRRLRICVHNVSRQSLEHNIDTMIFGVQNPFDVAVRESSVFIRKEMTRSCWLIIGHIFKSKKAIAITYFEVINIYIYYFYDDTDLNVKVI